MRTIEDNNDVEYGLLSANQAEGEAEKDKSSSRNCMVLLGVLVLIAIGIAVAFVVYDGAKEKHYADIIYKLDYGNFRLHDVPKDINVSWCASVDIMLPQSADQDCELYVIKRAGTGNNVMILDETGKYLRGWGKGMFTKPHAIRIQYVTEANSTVATPYVWVVDQLAHSVLRFTPNGDLLNTFGTPNISGNGTNPLQFDRPTEIAFDTKGNIYISEGEDTVNRIVKLNPDFTLIDIFGGISSNAKGQYQKPHSIDIDPIWGNLWVADQNNMRLQVVTPTEGEFLAQWNITSCGISNPTSVRVLDNARYEGHTQDKATVLTLEGGATDGYFQVYQINHENVCHLTQTVPLNNTMPHLLGIHPLTGDAFYTLSESPQCLFKLERGVYHDESHEITI